MYLLSKTYKLSPINIAKFHILSFIVKEVDIIYFLGWFRW
jgi:hypothetical protein